MPQVKPRRARRGTETRKKNYLVTSRYDAEEYEELEEAASRTGLTRASYQRVQSLKTPKTRSTRRPSIDRELLRRALWELGKIGTNLNQIARAVNKGETQDPDLEATLKEVRSSALAVARAFGQQP